MKILYLSAANSIHIVKWANAMNNLGHEVYILSCANHQAAENKCNENIKIIYLKYGDGIGYYRNASQVKKLIKEIKPDVINVHYASGYGTTARLSRIKNYLLNVWGSDVYDFPHESFLKKIILKKNLRAASLLASTSNSMAEETRKYTKKEIFITPFGVDTKLFDYKETPKRNNFVFLTIKALTPKYGIIGMIKAFKLFLDYLSSKDEKLASRVEYHIYGSGEQKEEIESLIKELGLEEHVFLKGYIENRLVPDVINASDVYLLKSELDSESFGVAAVEAMACYKPVIASDVSGFKEVIEDGKSGIIVDRFDLETYSLKMRELYFDEKLRKTLGENGRKRVLNLYSWDKNVEDMEKIYNRMKGMR